MKNKVIERYEEVGPGEYVIWSASDYAKPEDQIPLVKIKTNSEGKLYAVQPPTRGYDEKKKKWLYFDEFDGESYEIAQNSIESSQKSGKSTEEILIRVDKSLNHNDPYMSVEIGRESKGITDGGITLLAAQSLVTLRDDLKAAANLSSATEGSITDRFEGLTGVNYYTDKVAIKSQYDVILGLMFKDTKDTWNYIPPKDNPYIQDLKKLTASLIEKVNKKSGKKDMTIPKRYASQANINSKIREIKTKLDEIAKSVDDEDKFVNEFEKLLGVNYYTEDVTDYGKFSEILDATFGENYEGVEAPEENIIFINVKDHAEDLIEKILLENDPDFYNK